MLKKVRVYSSKWALCFILVISLSFILSSQVVKAADQYDVGVFYFTNWNPELNPGSIIRYESIYGRVNDWWSGVKDHSTSPGPWGNGSIPDREPMTGWYDDRQQSVIDQQILQASSRGIDHFAFYYYWKPKGGGEQPGQNAIYNFKNSPYKDLMKFYIDFVADGTWPSSEWNTMIVPKLINFMQDSSYKRTPSGRPIVAFYGDMRARFGGSAGVKQALDYLRAQAIAAGLQNPLLVFNEWNNLNSYIIDDGFDGFLPLNLAGVGIHNLYIPEDYATSYPVDWPGFVSPLYDNYLFIPGGLSGFDPRPWGKGFDVYVYADPSPQKFRSQLQNVKSYLDNHPTSMNIATFYDWNENGEGGVIEPTTLHGYGYLNAIQETFSLDNSAYKTRVQQLGLPDLDPNLRLEFTPEYATVTDGQVVKIQGKVTNKFTSSITSGTVSLNTGGWTITTSSGTNLAGLAPNASQNVEFQVQVGSGTFWTKQSMTASASYTVNGQNGNQSVSTFVVKAPIVNGVIEPAEINGNAGNLIVNIRNYSLNAVSGNYTIIAPMGWVISNNGQGTFSLSAFTGGVHTNRRTSNTFNVIIPDDAQGKYNVKIIVEYAGLRTESVTVVNVGNYLKNAGLEYDTAVDGSADEWTILGSPTLSMDTTTYADGIRSQKIVGTGYGNGVVQEWIPTSSNQNYTVEFWAKVNSGTFVFEEAEANASMQWLDANTFYTISAAENGGVWKKYSYQFTPTSNAAYMSIRALTWDSGQTDANIDGVVLKRASYNIIYNSDFESEHVINGLPDKWQTLGTSTLSRVTDSASGKYGQGITGTGYGNGIVQEWIPTSSNQNYTVEFWAKVNSGTFVFEEAEANASMQWLDANTFYTISAAENGGVWKKYSYQFTPTSNAAYMSIRLLTWDSGQTDAKVDGIVLQNAPLNLVYNCDFESEFVTNGVPNRWQTLGTTTLSRVTDSVSGKYGHKITGTGYGNGLVQEWEDIVDTEPYLIEAWVKVNAGVLAIEDGEADGNMVWLGSGVFKTVNNAVWTKYTLVYNPLPGARKISIRFLTWSGGYTEAVVDNVTARPARGMNLLVNEGFEQDLNVDGIADIWTMLGTATVTQDADRIEGSYSQKIVSTGYGNGVVQEWINVSPNVQYKLTVNTEVIGGQLAIAYGEATSAMQWIGQTNLQVIGTSGWQERTFTFTTAPNTAKLSIRFLGGSDITNTALVDLVKLERKDTP